MADTFRLIWKLGLAQCIIACKLLVRTQIFLFENLCKSVLYKRLLDFLFVCKINVDKMFKTIENTKIVLQLV